MSKRGARTRVTMLVAGPVLAFVLLLAASGGPAAASAVTGAHRPTAGRSVDGDGSTTTTLAVGTTTTLAGSLVVTHDWPPGLSDDSTPPVIPAGTVVGDAQRWLEAALTARIKQVASLQHQVDTSRSVTNSTQSAMDAIAQADTTGLTTLQNAAIGASDLPTLQSIATEMVVGYRVFNVFTEQCDEVLTAEDQLYAEHRLVGLESALEAAIAAEQSGKVASQLSARIADYGSQLSSVETTNDAALTALLSLTVTDFSGSMGTLDSTRVALSGSDQALSAAREDLRVILSALAKPGGLSGSVRAAIRKGWRIGRVAGLLAS